MISKKKALAWLIAIVILTNAGTYIATNYLKVSSGDKYIVDKSTYDLINQFNKLFTVKDIIDQKYVDKVDNNKLVEGAVKGLAEGLGDPYTVYMSPKEYEAFNVQTQGTYAGIGITVTSQDNKLTVVAPIEDTPGEKAGLKTGDVILRVDDKDVTGNKMDDAVALMKGKPGTKVKLTVVKAGTTTPVELTITRQQIVLKTVKGEVLSSTNNIGYIRITTFDENTASNFKKTLTSLQSKGIKGLILDLRDNPGGLLDQCAEIADNFLGEGTIVYTIDNNGKKEIITSNANKINIPLVILVNGGTASASEIVSGAVKDTNSGVLIGTKTFGKGLVQTIVPLKDNSAVKVTIARYYTPSGVCIQGTGIEPNIVIDLPEELKQKPDLTRSEDVQLSRAIEVINEKMK